jgi:hypothetical protein
MREWTQIHEFYLLPESLFKDVISSVLRRHFYHWYIYKYLHDFGRKIWKEETYLLDLCVDGRINELQIATVRGCRLNWRALMYGPKARFAGNEEHEGSPNCTVPWPEKWLLTIQDVTLFGKKLFKIDFRFMLLTCSTYEYILAAK